MLVASDLHLDNFPAFGQPDSDPRFPGCNSRAVEILRALERVYLAAVAGGDKYVIIPGDIFHRRGVLLVPLVNALCKIFDRFKNEFDVLTIVLPGNHDYVDRHARYESEHLHALYGMSGTVAVVSEPQVFKIREASGTGIAGFIPYTPNRELWIKRSQSLAALMGASEISARPVIFAHQSFDGARTGPHEYIMKEGLGTLDVPEEVRVYSGHYHMHQSIGEWVEYVGGLVQQNLGEREYRPGHMKIDLVNDARSFIENLDSPRFRLYEGASPVELAKERAEAMRFGDYLTVRWTGKASDLADVQQELREDKNASVVSMACEELEAPRMALKGSESPEQVAEAYVKYVAGLRGFSVEKQLALWSKGNEILATLHRNASV